MTPTPPHLQRGENIAFGAENVGVGVEVGVTLARHFLVCTISFEPVVGFLPNLHGYIIGTYERTD